MAQWQKLAPIPRANEAYSTQVLHQSQSLFVIQAIKYQPGLFQYSFINDSWVKYKIQSNYNDIFHCSRNHAAAINDDNTIYLCDRKHQITIFKPKSDNECVMRTIKNLDEIKSGTMRGTGVMINNEFHIIGGKVSEHVKFNSNEQKCEILHDLKVALNLNAPRFTAKSKIRNNILLLFGGLDGDERMDRMHEYDIINDQWARSQLKLPKPLSSVASTQILNGQFVLLFGGNDGKYINDIYVYSIRDKTFRESKIKCPERGCYGAFTINDKVRDSLVTFGWIRRKWRACGINSHLFPPEYLIRIMCGYYLNERVHLLNTHTGDHYKINVFDIIKIN